MSVISRDLLTHKRKIACMFSESSSAGIVGNALGTEDTQAGKAVVYVLQ